MNTAPSSASSAAASEVGRRRIIYSERAKEELWLLERLRHRTVKQQKTHGMTRNPNGEAREAFHSCCSVVQSVPSSSWSFLSLPSFSLPKILCTFSASTERMPLSPRNEQKARFLSSYPLLFLPPFPPSSSGRRFPVSGAASTDRPTEVKPMPMNEVEGALVFSKEAANEKTSHSHRTTVKIDGMSKGQRFRLLLLLLLFLLLAARTMSLSSTDLAEKRSR